MLEELSLRTSRIQPMKNKLHAISQKMHQLENIISGGGNGDYIAEDIEAMGQELNGLQELVGETPKQLDKRIRAIERVFGQYEETKRYQVTEEDLAANVGRKKNRARASENEQCVYPIECRIVTVSRGQLLDLMQTKKGRQQCDSK